MADSIFLIDDSGALHRLDAEPYDSEDRLQALIADYPHLLPGEQINPQDPCRWILVAREMAIADEPGAGARWSADHLFLDQDGVPTIVEVKRVTDTRIRREVIGQLLDYAAHGPSNWPVELVRSLFERECEARDRSPIECVADELMPGTDYDQYWEKVGRNLQAGRIRLLLVADSVPIETQRVIEFLNSQMTRSEVLAIEIPHLRSGTLRALAPRVIGQTAVAQDTKRTATRTAKAWDRASYLADLAEAEAGGAAPTVERMLEWAEGKGISTRGGGGMHGSMLFDFSHEGVVLPLFGLYTYRSNVSVEMRPQFMVSAPGFVTEESRQELLQRLNAIPGVDMPLNRASKRPSFNLSALAPDRSFDAFTSTIVWAIDIFRAAIDRAGIQ